MTDAQILEVIRELGGATTSGDWIMRFGRAIADLATPVQPVPASEPFGYYVHVPAEQRGKFVFDLDDALDDLTDCECHVTELRASAPATQDKGEGA